MQKKLILLLCVFSLLLAAVYYVPRGYQQTIVIGMYAECPLEAAEEIAFFRNEHPNASLKLTNSINKADYNEWLAQGFLSGSAPDVFVIPPEDLEKYIQLGALQDLSLLLEQHGLDTAAARAPFYALTINTSKGEILMGISSRAKYPRLTFELLKAFQK